MTNDHAFIPRTSPNFPLLNKLETFLPLPLAWITLVDFSSGFSFPSFATVANHIAFANGIALSPTGKEVAVAECARSRVLTYSRNPATNELVFTNKISVPFKPDNVAFDDSLETADATAFDRDGRFLRGLIVAGHPSGIDLVKTAKDPRGRTSPSWVVEIRRDGGTGQYQDQAVYSKNVFGQNRGWHYRTLYQSKWIYVAERMRWCVVPRLMVGREQMMGVSLGLVVRGRWTGWQGG